MSYDNTNLTVQVRHGDDAVLAQVRTAILEVAEMADPDPATDQIDSGSLDLILNDFDYDEFEAVIAAIDAVREQVGDFAFFVHTDPIYDALGDLVVHVPGMERLVAECDQDGQVQVSASTVRRLLAECADPAQFAAKMRAAAGIAQVDAYLSYRA